MFDLKIILRTCLDVNCFSGNDRILNKKETIDRCSLSLAISIENAILAKKNINLIIVDDHSSDLKFLDHFKGIYYTLINLEDTGNGKSLEKVFTLAQEDDVLTYVVEDDYLHDPCAITKIINDYHFIKRNINSTEIIIHPCDYPDRYKAIYPSYIVLGMDRHWRTILHTTCTLAAHSSIFRKYKENFMGMTRYGIDPEVNEDTTINKTYIEIPCFSPMPSLVEHLQYTSTLSPFYFFE